MAKTFYTERDIEDLARQGVTSLEVNADVVLTELAREKAELINKVRAAVVARLGNEVDPALLDTIIKRVMDSL